jgi:hypothetical protein
MVEREERDYRECRNLKIPSRISALDDSTVFIADA